ncbi:MAG: DUF6125 family protein [Candidatus Binatia bacterium]
MTLADLTSEERETLLRRCWYGHDACWFRSVAEKLGLEAANDLNRRALRLQGRREARELVRTLGLPGARGLGDVLAFFDVAAHLLAPVPLMEFWLEVVDECTYDVRLERCFVHESIVRAGLADAYVCAVFDRIYGWHEGLNLPLTEEPEGLPCARAAGRECQRRLCLRSASGDAADRGPAPG